MGRPSHMDEHENRKAVAALHAEGKTRGEIAEEYHVSPDTVGSWLRRQDVKAEVEKILRDRTQRVLRRTDAKIEAILQDTSKLSLDDLLKIRKEFAPNRQEIVVSDGTRDAALEELWARVADDPDAAAKILGVEGVPELEAGEAEVVEHGEA